MDNEARLAAIKRAIERERGEAKYDSEKPTKYDTATDS